MMFHDETVYFRNTVIQKLASSMAFALLFFLMACTGSKKIDLPEITGPVLNPNPVFISPTTIAVKINTLTSFSASGGDGNYTYSVFTGVGSILSTTGSYTAPSSPGFCVVRVTDGLGRFANAVVAINPPVQISPTTKILNLNSTQTFTAVGGISPYVFSIATGTGFAQSSSGVFTSPATAGAATVRVTDSIGDFSEATVNFNTPISLSPTSKTLLVNTTQTFTASNGFPPYSYSVLSGTGTIDSSSGVYTAPATVGTAVVKVTDSLGTTATSAITITTPLAITPANLNLAVNNVGNFSATGGTSPFTFSIVSGTGSINSSTGQYTAAATSGSAVVRLTDAVGLTADATVNVNPGLSITPTGLTVFINSTNTFAGSGGVLPYSFSVVSGSGIINSSTGDYTAGAANGSAVIQVMDGVGNTAIATVTITTPLTISPTTLKLAVNNISTLSAAGGTGSLVFSILSGNGAVNSSTGQFTAPAVSGTTVVRVTDTLGAVADSTITINPALAISPTNVTVFINSTNSFSATGGVPTYSYAVVSGPGSIVSGTGVYTAPVANGATVLKVTDSFGNISSTNVTITTPLIISPANVTLAVNNIRTLTASGGTGALIFSIFSGGGSVDSSTGQFTAPATAGTTVVRVTDTLGATADSTITINPPLAISPVSVTIASVSTESFSTVGGVSPYTYSKSTGPGSINSSTGVYTPGAPGTANIRVTDSLGNTSDAVVTITGPLTVSPLTAYVVVNDDLALSAAGGTAPYTFSIFSGGGIIDSVTGIYTAPATTGSATLRTTDSVGATVNTSVTIYNALTLSPLTFTIATNATKSFSATGGIGARTFSMYSGNGTINSSTGLYSSPAGGGTDIVQVTDSIGNSVQATVTIVSQLTISPPNLKLPVFSTVTYTSILGTAPYSYSVLSGGGSINILSGIYTAASTAGVGSVQVRDAATNSDITTVTHIEPVQTASGTYHTCVRYNEGSVKCWGLGSSGQLGNGSTANLGASTSDVGGNLPFVNLGTGRTAISIAAGLTHSCALLDNATVKCWGQNTYGELGIGSTTNMGASSNQMGDNLPSVNVGTGRTVSKVFAFGYSTCVILDNNVSKCFGRNGSGQLGQGDIISRGTAANQMGDSLLAIPLGSGRYATKLTGGLDFTCALLDNATLKCFGSSRYGQLGYESTTNLGDNAGEMTTLAAVYLGTGRTVLDVVSSYNHTCALLDNSTVKCWGRNNTGQLGAGNTTNIGDTVGSMGNTILALPFTTFTPTKIFGGRQWSCAMDAAGGTRCWGLGTSGQLMNGSTSNIGSSAGQIAALTNINFGTSVVPTSITSGYYTGCAITTNKRIKCWGSALNGALLNGNTANNLGDVSGELGDGLAWVNH